MRRFLPALLLLLLRGFFSFRSDDNDGLEEWAAGVVEMVEVEVKDEVEDLVG